MDKPAKPLRILVIVNLPWDARLGASRVWIELAEQWLAAGHIVEKYSLSDAFPGVRATRVTFALRQLIFIRKAAAFVRKNAQRFDVVDALIGTLPFSRDDLAFPGIIVARSVGLYRFYNRFEQTAERRWPRPERGKFVGRLLYRFARQRLLQASDAALRKADLINVPNADEAAHLRQDLGSSARVIVQPYGLTEERRAALHAAAAPVGVRLAQKRVCFIGMWSARKGAHDWAAIIDRVRQQVPEARFKFLGTMIDAQALRCDLGPIKLQGFEFISEFAPDDLPQLLSDCTVAAFPSYVEGFGLAVMEQLAAGIPVVAYDTSGPRDILRRELPELLVPSGEIARFAAVLSRILLLKEENYAPLAERSVRTATMFSWAEIARDTVSAYVSLLEQCSKPVVFAQPFSLFSTGGGARILRGLLKESTRAIAVVCTSPQPPAPAKLEREHHMAVRPFFGFVEHSRLARLPQAITPFFRASFRKKLRAFCRARGAVALHAVPHGYLDFYDSYLVAHELRLPFFLNVQDDFAYSARGRVSPKRADHALREVWNGAELRFVISRQMGEEYCRRYGEREFIIVTDGVERLRHLRGPRSGQELNIYFMGLFHLSYERNLRVLLRAIDQLRAMNASAKITVTLRCDQLHARDLQSAAHLRVLPFGSEADVQSDLDKADLLYLPLPFGPEFEQFVRLSLSTKMVTYLGSGLPILYHGPQETAAHELLAEHRAALLVTSLDSNALASALGTLCDDPARGRGEAQNALDLARSDFMLENQRRKFWQAISPFTLAR